MLVRRSRSLRGNGTGEGPALVRLPTLASNGNRLKDRLPSAWHQREAMADARALSDAGAEDIRAAHRLNRFHRPVVRGGGSEPGGKFGVGLDEALRGRGMTASGAEPAAAFMLNAAQQAKL